DISTKSPRQLQAIPSGRMYPAALEPPGRSQCVPSQPRGTSMSALVSRMAVFFGLAYAFTWMGWLGNAIWPSDYWLLPMNPFGPLMAAPIAILIMDGVEGLKAWGKRLINFRAPLWVYAAALLG